MPAKRRSTEERIRRSAKQLAVTLAEIKAIMDANFGDFEADLHVARMRGRLRLILKCRHTSFASWSMSLILNDHRFNGRIDCIDWEPLFDSIDGRRCSGFHRHVWNSKQMSCDRFKVPMDGFNPASVEEFILAGLQFFNVNLLKGELPNVSLSL